LAGVMICACLCNRAGGETAPADSNQAGPASLLLVDAINHALAHNRSILLAELTAGEASVGVNEAHSEFAIRFAPEAGISTDEDQDESTFAGAQTRRKFATGGEAGIRAGYTSDGNSDGAYVQLDVRQPLFRNAGPLVNREPLTRAMEAERDTRRALYIRKMELMLEVVRGYEAILQFERKVELDRQSLDRLEDLLTLTRVKEETGGATRLDTLRVDLQRGEAEATLQNSELVLSTERDDFFNLIGWTQSLDIALSTPPLLDIQPPPFLEAVATAFSNRLDYARALDQLTTAERQILLARKKLQPDIEVSGNYRMRGGLDDRSSTDLSEESWFAGVTVVPGLDLYQRRAGLSRSISARDQQIISVTDLDYEIEREIKQQIRSYERARVNYTIALRNTELAWKRLQLAESMFRLGQGDNFSVTDAEGAHAAAVAAELSARAEASLSGYRLLNALGILLEVPHELKPSL